MATKTGSAAVTGIQPKGLRVGLNAITSVWSAAAGTSLSNGDVIQMVKVPKGATPVFVAISNGSGVAKVNVGDGVSAARYFSDFGISLDAVLTVMNSSYRPYTYSTDDTIDIVVASLSIGTITGGLNMIAIFSLDAVP